MWVKKLLLLKGNQYIITTSIKPLFSIMGDNISRCLQHTCKTHSHGMPRIGAIVNLAIVGAIVNLAIQVT